MEVSRCQQEKAGLPLNAKNDWGLKDVE